MGAPWRHCVHSEAVQQVTDRPRYLVGDDARGSSRTRRTLPDQDYVAFMRKQFAAE